MRQVKQVTAKDIKLIRPSLALNNTMDVFYGDTKVAVIEETFKSYDIMWQATFTQQFTQKTLLDRMPLTMSMVMERLINRLQQYEIFLATEEENEELYANNPNPLAKLPTKTLREAELELEIYELKQEIALLTTYKDAISTLNLALTQLQHHK